MFGTLSERERTLIDLLSSDPGLSVPEIADRLKVSQVTIRSDFAALEGKGLLIRPRGGAMPAFHPDILEHLKDNPAAKQRIAKAAADLVGDGDTVMINDGTTSSLIARYLLGKRDVRLVTNSTLLLPYARVNPSLHTTLIGGEFRASTEALVGPQAVAQLETYHVKLVFVGTGGFSIERGLTTHLMEGAEIARRMTALGDTVVMVADSSKYDRNGFVKILPLEAVDIVITDSGLDPAIVRRMEDGGRRVIVV
jgi:DeoR family galactitol utilization operon repressor